LPVNQNRGPESVRVDRWLWSVRVFKTRNQAAVACRNGQVRMAGVSVKASKLLRVGDKLEVKRGRALISVTVIDLLEKRIGPKAINKFKEEHILQEDPVVKMKSVPARTSGQGRPTKRQRRAIESFLDEVERGSEL
jgi:ribosome-associated heat shock protein Hsp15